MQIILRSLLAGAHEAEGVTVIIDVYRAMTSTAVLLAGGVKKLYMVAETEEARALRAAGRVDTIVGEVDGIRPPGFDFGNSPTELSRVDLRDREVALSTRAGTTGLVAATKAQRLFAGAFVNAAATAAVLRRLSPAKISLVAMGWNAASRTDEDEQCALYLRNLVQGRAPDREAVRSLVLSGAESLKFGDPAQPWFPREDRDAALDFDRYYFAIEIVREDGLLVARKFEPRTT